MTAKAASVKPNTRPNFVLAGITLCLGLMMGWLAFDLARLLGVHAVAQDYGFLAVMVGIALLLLAGGWRLFTRPFGARSAITLGADAIVFEHWGLWGLSKQYAIPRTEVLAFWVINAPFTQQFSVEITPAQAITMGLCQASTRQNSAFVAAPTLRFSGYGFHDPIPLVLEALRADLAAVGLALGEVNAGRIVAVGKRWPVVKL
jgi:hypothetical protein